MINQNQWHLRKYHILTHTSCLKTSEEITNIVKDVACILLWFSITKISVPGKSDNIVHSRNRWALIWTIFELCLSKSMTKSWIYCWVSALTQAELSTGGSYIWELWYAPIEKALPERKMKYNNNSYGAKAKTNIKRITFPWVYKFTESTPKINIILYWPKDWNIRAEVWTLIFLVILHVLSSYIFNFWSIFFSWVGKH